MRWKLIRRLVCALALCLAVRLSTAQALESGTKPGAPGSAYIPVHNFVPSRDAYADIQAAVAEAQRTGKRVIVDIGGDWCVYCHQMDQFFTTHSDLAQLRDRNFIVVAVFYSSENKNQKALSHYPKVEGIPHIFVLEKDGSVLHSQHVLDLRVGNDYDPGKMKDFLTRWSPRDVLNGAKTAADSDPAPPKRD
jgi:thiol:disulfide interchange protein